MEQKNRFSALLEQLVATAEVKHFVLAKALQYDVSYISKWIGGRVLPTEKSASDVLQKISQCLVENASAAGLDQLRQDYEVRDAGELGQAIYDNLIAEYYYVQQLQQNSGSVVAPNVSFYPELSMKKFIEKMNHPVLRRVKSQNIMAAFDLFSIANEFRPQIVSLATDKSAERHAYPNVHFSLLIHLDKRQGETIRDALFIANLLVNSSLVDFQLHGSEFACGKLMFVVKHDFAITGMLIRPDTCAAVAVCEGEENSTPLYHDIQSLCTRETMLFRRVTMGEMLGQSMDYVHALLAPERHWMLGHLTEHLLPDDLFREFAGQMVSSGRIADASELLNLHDLTSGILDCGNVQLLIFEPAISRLIINGELDFFNHRVVLDFPQRLRLLEHLRKLVRESAALQVRMVHDPLVSDFQYSACPSVFLSSTVSYLRMDTKWLEENLLLKINRAEMQELYSAFFHEIWNDESRVVSDREEIDRFICHLMQGLQLLANVTEQ